MHIVVICGARPNFVKIAPILWQTQRGTNVEVCLVHTGQHSDARMSERRRIHRGRSGPLLVLLRAESRKTHDSRLHSDRVAHEDGAGIVTVVYGHGNDLRAAAQALGYTFRSRGSEPRAVDVAFISRSGSAAKRGPKDGARRGRKSRCRGKAGLTFSPAFEIDRSQDETH